MIRSLKELSTIYYGKSPNSIRVEDSQFPIYGTGGQVGCASAPLFNGPLVVVARKGTLSKPIFSESACWVIDTAYALITKPDVDAKWLYYNLDHYNLESLNEATGVPSISRDYLYRVEVEFVSKPEQCQIQKILSTIDNLIKQTHSLIAKYNAIKHGMMQDLFSRGIDNNGELRLSHTSAPELFKKSELGWIPKEWDVYPLSFAVPKAEYGISTSLIEDPVGVPVLRMNNLKDGTFVLDDLKYSDTAEALLLQLNHGDVLFNRTNSYEHVGRTSIWTSQLSCVSFASYLVRLTPYPNIMTPPFLNMWLNLPETQLRIRQYATPAVHQVNINPTNLRKILVKIPPVPEQAAITRMINQMEATVAIERTCFDKLQLLKSGLMQDLLTGKVRVKVDEPTESAQDVGVHQS